MGRSRKWPPSILTHKSGRNFIRVCGRDYYLPGAPGSPETKAEYARLIRELSGAPPLVKLAPPKAPTVADVCAAFLRHAESTYPPDGKEAGLYRAALSVAASLYARLPAADFRVPELRAVREKMVGKWCRNVTNRQVVRVRTCWRWAEEEGQLVPPGAWAHLCSLRSIPRSNRAVRQTPDRPAVEWELVRRVLRHLPPVGRAMVLLQWYTGMRPGEVRTMRRADVREGLGGLLVYDSAEHKTAHIDGSRRVVPLGRMAQRVLRRWLAAADKRGGYLFPVSRQSRVGAGCYSEFGYAQLLRRACKRAGVPRFTAYQIRHAYRLRVTRAMGMDAARAGLGHRTVGTTQLYARGVDQQTAADVARRLG